MNGDDGKESQEGEMDVKEMRRQYPSGWLEITEPETVRIIIDTLMDSPPSHKFNKTQFSERSGLSRKAIIDHIDKLVELGVVEEDKDGNTTFYELNESGRVTTELFELNSAVNAVKSGVSSKNIDQVSKTEDTIIQITRNSGSSVDKMRDEIQDVIKVDS